MVPNQKSCWCQLSFLLQSFPMTASRGFISRAVFFGVSITIFSQGVLSKSSFDS